MSLRCTLALLVCLAALSPGSASAAGVGVVEREEPLAAVRSSLALEAPGEFTLVGIHWQGSGEVWFRTAGAAGSWSEWRLARPEDEDLPDPASGEQGAAAAWNVGNPWWTGSASRIQYRVSGEVTRLRTFFVDSQVTAEDTARAAQETAAGETALQAAEAAAERPPIVRRPGWGANETIVRGSPSFADRLRLAVVHHTAGTNSYSKAQSAAIVRGILQYHVTGNGWNDIGYNFLVDKYGQIFEGRKGGLARNVVGAHAQGFNTGSVGVAVLGTYGSSSISSAARSAVEKLLAWRLDVAHVDPGARVNFVSFGNERFKAGTTVRLRTVSGHRDTGYTSCPGSALYSRLGSIATSTSQIGLPKLYDPEVTGGLGGPVRFTARLSASRSWVVQVRNAAGAVVAQGSGAGTAVDWTWSSSGTPAGAYTYVISSGSQVRSATGAVPGPPPLAIGGLVAKPAVVTPNGDWSGERTTVSFSVSRQASVGVRVVDAASGALVRTLLAPGLRPAGAMSLTWDARNGGGTLVPDGRYRVEVTAEAGVEEVVGSAAVTVDRTLGALSVSPALFSPNGDGRLEKHRIFFGLTRPATTRVEIRRKGKTVRTLSKGTRGAGSHKVVWNGRLANGTRVADGAYHSVVLATTSLGTRTLSRPIALDATRPTVRVNRFWRAGGVTRVSYTVSEAARMTIRYGTRVLKDGGTIVRDVSPGKRTMRLPGASGIVKVAATDAAENRSAPVVRRR